MSLLLVLPAVIITLVFVVYPVSESVRLSFTDWNGLGEPDPVGLANFIGLATDADFLTALGNNFLFAAIVTTLSVALGTLLALALDRKVRFWRFYRFVYFLPNVLPGTIVAIMWANSFDPNFGWFSNILEAIVPQWSTGLLANPDTAIYVICFVAIWQSVGFPMIIVMGGLQNVPKEIVEAARLDGAGPVSLAWHISLPLCKDVIATVTLLQLIYTFKVFDIVQALTKGGPGTSTQVFGTLIYRDAFIQGEFGYASAIAVVASLLIVGISLIYLSIVKPGSIGKS